MNACTTHADFAEVHSVCYLAIRILQTAFATETDAICFRLIAPAFGQPTLLLLRGAGSPQEYELRSKSTLEVLTLKDAAIYAIET